MCYVLLMGVITLLIKKKGIMMHKFPSKKDDL